MAIKRIKKIILTAEEVKVGISGNSIRGIALDGYSVLFNEYSQNLFKLLQEQSKNKIKRRGANGHKRNASKTL